MGVVRSFCRICIANCGVLVEVEDDRVLAVRGDPDHPVSRGYTCAKGRALPDVHHGPRRLTGGLVRRHGGLGATTAEEATADAADALAEVAAAHGVETIGVFTGGGGFVDPTAGWALRSLAGKLGLHHVYSTASVDSIAKTYVTALMAGTTALIPHPDELGSLLLLIGSNPVVSHGQTTMFSDPVERIRAARARGEVHVVDPRTTESARLADHHLAPRAGTDWAILAFLVREALAAPDLDRASLDARAAGVDALAAAVAPWDLAATAARTGLEPAALRRLAGAVRAAGRLAVVTGTGTTMSPAGNLVEWLAWALLVVTGSFDRPGGMWFNPGYFSRFDRRERLPRARTGEPGPPSRPTLARLLGEWPAAVIPDEIRAGTLRGLVVVGGNLVAALPDTDEVVDALGALDVLVVLEVERTATVELASHAIACPHHLERPDVLALETFAPRFGNQYTPAVVPAPEGRPPAWRTLARLGRRLGVDVLGDLDPETADAHDVLERVVRGGDLDALRAVDGPLIEQDAVYGWAEERLPTGRWDLAPEPLLAQLADVSSRPPAPLVLLPRRQPRHQNAQPFRPGDRPTLLVHPADAAELGLADGEAAEVTGSAGSLRVVAEVTDAIARGSVSVPHGYVDTNVNHLLHRHDTDDRTGMPHLSGAPVEVRPCPAPAAAP